MGLFFVTGQICGESCCSQNLENEMYKHNQLLVDKYVKDSIAKISSIIDTRAKKFDDVFRSMMNSSKREFHHMFERTYGKIYLQNAEVFSDFFSELETYYKKGTVRLSDTMDTFFGILYQRMFTVINAQYNFDDKYLECVSDHMAEMKPFGDVPHKLGIQLRRSFVATRTFYKSLVKGADAANMLTALGIDEECYRESTKMRYCGACKAENGLGPCPGYCSNTMQACFRYHTEFSTIWDNFVDAIDKVGERLLGPYNIEVVVEPLNIKISEAIMNFQESGTEVSQKIYGKCGKPTTLSRPKRKADYKDSTDNPNMEIKIEPMKAQGKKKHKKVPETVDNKSVLEKIIADIKQKIKDTKQFWLNLPYQYCNNLSLHSSNNETSQCWNGTGLGTYDKPAQKTNVGESQLLNAQVYVLQGLTDKLRKAFQGQEVEMVDDTEETLAGSGSGSGDGDFEEEERVKEEGKDIVFNENREDSVFPTPASPSSTKMPEVVRTSSSASIGSMSLTRALVQYLLPMVLVWFGGAITNLL
ncbi:hypothetical protein NQ315_016306 [Exocentrus adspersus]|uniref:Glypican-6 n=1 Tax=Exocentrus adspersus TaxID=1586481 RepID=A0AAV8VQ82_9CUCU|nr:hypothetical protein NQ315_016306 [Exocentrus adspersus]